MEQDLDIAMGYLGDWGKYQAWQFTLHILAALTAGMHMLSLVTVAAVPDPHRCELPGIDVNRTMTHLNVTQLEMYFPKLETGKLDFCSVYNGTDTNETVKCTDFVYDDTYYTSSRGIEWNFVCDRRWMGAVAQSVYMLGVFTGAVTLGGAADKYGRKAIFCWSALMQLLLGVCVAFIPNYYGFLFLRYLYGIFGSAGSYITGFVLTMEIVGPSKRTSCGIAFQAAFALGLMLVAGWGALITADRMLLQCVYGLHSLLLIGHYWLIDESPRWLWAQGRIRESSAIIQKALRMNNSTVKLDVDGYVQRAKALERKESGGNKQQDSSAGVADMFKTPNLRAKSLNICLCWFANSLAYYGLSLNTGKLEGNPYLMLFFTGLVEIPGYVLTVYLMDRTGRRSLISFDMIAGGICCIVAAYMIPGSAGTVTVVMIGKFFIACSFAIVYNYSAELFPTVIRNSAMGVGSMCARLSGTMTPLISLLDSFDPTVPAIIFAVIALVSGFLCLFLPETLGYAMPQTILDGENFGKGDTFFTSCFKSKKDKVSAIQSEEQMQPLSQNNR